ncbi:MAG: hypothetical protein ACFFFG_16715 [Candidatus Thorarchaeota archaeon]
MRVLHVEGKNLIELSPPYEFLNGDVYIVDNSDVSAGLQKKVYIWVGSQAFADDKAVGAWAAKQLDLKDKEIDIDTVTEGNEPEDFSSLINFVVVTGDTPGFLKHVDVNAEEVSYALYRVKDADLSDGSSSDDIVIENVPMTSDSLVSDDVFVLDAYHDLYVWIGSGSQVGEKAAGNRLVRKLDVDRERNPMIYTIHQYKEPPGFFELMANIAGSGKIRKGDASQIGKGITDRAANIPSLGAPPPSGIPEVKPMPKPSAPADFREEPSPRDLGLTSTATTPPPVSSAVVKLYYNHASQAFSERGSKDEAVLEIDEANQMARLIFSESSGLILQRTASRQARGICRTGFLLSDGKRVGQNCSLSEFKGEMSIDDRLLQVGHHYR